MKYVDGFLLPVKKNKISVYKKMALLGGKIWMEHGALQYFECALEDAKAPFGLAFPKLLKVKRGETVFFSFIIFKSRKHRDAVNKKVMADPRMNMSDIDMKNMPFDSKRMGYGGFAAMVEM